MNPNNSTSAPQVTEVYDKMGGFVKATHWSKPYYSSLSHNNPQLPFHLLEHVNCTYLSTPGRAPTLLALKQHAQSLAVLISLLAPAQYGGTFEPPNEGKINGDAPFAAEQAWDWLNNLHVHYNTEDDAHKKPLNALTNLVKSNSDTEGPKWHCPLETTKIEHAEKHPFQKYRPYESHMTLLMHANEILERLDHEYSAMGGILGIIPLKSENVEEQRALEQAKTTLIGQWILYTQNLVVRMHELEIAYGNSLDLLANEAIVPMQHTSIHGPDGRSGREIVFPQDRWILANAGEDVFTFIHQMLDRAEAHQDARDDVFADQNVLGDAAHSSNDELKYRGIVKADLSTRFYRLRGSGHGPLFILPAFGDRPGTKHTRDIENRPTVVTIPQPKSKETVSAWESKHMNVDAELLKLSKDSSSLAAKVSQLESTLKIRDLEVGRLKEMQELYEGVVSTKDQSLMQQIVYLNKSVRQYQTSIQKASEREDALKQEMENLAQAIRDIQVNADPVSPLLQKVNSQLHELRDLQKQIKERDKKIEDLARDNDTLRMLRTSSAAATNQEYVAQLNTQLSNIQQERQALHHEIHALKKAKRVQGRILNFPDDCKLDYGSTFEDTNLGITACSTSFYQSLLAAERERNDHEQRLDLSTLSTHTMQAELDKYRAEAERLRKDNDELRKGTGKRNINLPYSLRGKGVFKDEDQMLTVITTSWYNQLVAAERSTVDYNAKISSLQDRIKVLEAPTEVDLSGVYRKNLGDARVYRDPEHNVAMLTAAYFDELQASDQAKIDIQNQLNECLRHGQISKQEAEQARAQLKEYQQSQRDAVDQLPDLQNELEDTQSRLKKSLEQCQRLEQQNKNLTASRPPSDLNVVIAEREAQLNESRARHDEAEADLAELEDRHNKLRLNETNLRAEVESLRKQLSETAGERAPTTGRTQQQQEKDGKDLHSALEELEMYKEELDSMQTVCNDLQEQVAALEAERKGARPPQQQTGPQAMAASPSSIIEIESTEDEGLEGSGFVAGEVEEVEEVEEIGEEDY